MPERDDPSGTSGRYTIAGLSSATRELLAALVAPPERAPERVPRAFDGLDVIRPLGRGGMGEVLLAEERALGREVAVKVLYGSAGDAWLREAHVVGAVHHPGIVGLHRVGIVVGRPYLVYEFVRGSTLSAVPMPLRIPRMLAIGRDLAWALAAVHAAGVVHADVKPSNVMLAPDPVRSSAELTKLIDFGIAHREKGHAHVGFGTPLYMAPEVRQRGEATPQSDAYSLALVLIEMLTGTPDVRALRALRGPALPRREVVAVVERAVADDPARRPATRELFEVLEAAADRPTSEATASHDAGPSVAPSKPESDPFALAGLVTMPLHHALAARRAEQSIWLPGASLVCVRQAGALDVDGAEVLVSVVTDLVARGFRPCIFIDGRRTVEESIAYRRAFDALDASLPVLSEIHLLGRAGAPATPKTRVHPTVVSFVSALRRAIAWVEPML